MIGPGCRHSGRPRRRGIVAYVPAQHDPRATGHGPGEHATGTQCARNDHADERKQCKHGGAATLAAARDPMRVATVDCGQDATGRSMADGSAATVANAVDDAAL